MNIAHTPLEQGFILIPVNNNLQKQFGIGNLSVLEKNKNLQSIYSFGSSLSEKGKAAYVEAEFFGGTGTQASVTFENGSKISGPKVSLKAINIALQFLGVSKSPSLDEFDSLGLGKYRHTEKRPVVLA